MGRVEQRLVEVGLTLPAPLTAPPGHTFNFELVKVHNGLAYVAGHGPFDGPTPLMQGLIGRDLTVEQGYEAARLTGLSILASLKRELGDLDRVTQWIRAVGYVHCAPDFGQTRPWSTASATSWSSSGAIPGAMRAPRRDKARRP